MRDYNPMYFSSVRVHLPVRNPEEPPRQDGWKCPCVN